MAKIPFPHLPCTAKRPAPNIPKKREMNKMYYIFFFYLFELARATNKLSCDVGYRLEGTICVRGLECPVEMRCPPGYSPFVGKTTVVGVEHFAGSVGVHPAESLSPGGSMVFETPMGVGGEAMVHGSNSGSAHIHVSETGFYPRKLYVAKDLHFSKTVHRTKGGSDVYLENPLTHHVNNSKVHFGGEVGHDNVQVLPQHKGVPLPSYEVHGEPMPALHHSEVTHGALHHPQVVHHPEVVHHPLPEMVHHIVPELVHVPQKTVLVPEKEVHVVAQEQLNEHAKAMCARTVTVLPTPWCADGLKGEVMEGEVKCVEVLSEEVVHTCRPGFTLREEVLEDGLVCPVCEKTREIDSEVVCMEGYELTRAGECVKLIQIPPKAICAPGFQLNDEEGVQNCVKIEAVPAIPICPNGTIPSIKNPQNCEKRLEVTPAKRCLSEDMIFVDDICWQVQTVPVQKRCEGDNMLKSISPKGEPECQVEIALPATLRCEEGSTLDPLTGDCIKRSKPVPVCIGGGVYDEVQKKCIFREIALSPTLCPEGFEPEGNQCVSRIPTEPTNVCPPNFELNSAKECVQIRDVKMTQICPKDYHRLNNNCMKPLYQPISLICKFGFTLDKTRNVCILPDKVPIERQCPNSEFILKHNKCILKQRTPTLTQCPPHAVNTEGQCLSIAQVDPIPKCIAPYHYNIATRMCEDKEIVPARPYCPPAHKYEGLRCISEERVPAIPACKTGSTCGPTNVTIQKNVTFSTPKKIVYKPKIRHKIKTASFFNKS